MTETCYMGLILPSEIVSDMNGEMMTRCNSIEIVHLVAF